MLKKIILLGSIIFSSKAQQNQWILPSRLFPIVNEVVDFKLNQGSLVNGQAVNLEENQFKVKHFGPRAQKISVQTNVMKVNFIEPGIHIITMNQDNSSISVLSSAQWNEFLEQKDAKHQVRNAYLGDKILNISHFNKIILVTDNQKTEDFLTETDQKLEIVPINNPFEGNRISLKVLFNGEIAPGITIIHLNNTGNGRIDTFGEHTDKNGIVNFNLSRGLHTFETVKIEEQNQKSNEYQVTISSLTLGKK